MGIWIEIHCDVRKDGCFENINDGSMGMAMSTKSSMMDVYAIVKKDAISRGWHYRASKWICPHCNQSPNDYWRQDGTRNF